MTNMYEMLKETLASKTREELDAEYESITHESFWKRWVEKVHSLNQDIRKTLIEKVKAKYESDEYISSEYKKGYEPRTELYDLLLNYAEKYGVEYYPKYANNDFVGARYLIDGYIIELLIGQGSVIHIYTVNEFNSKKNNFINF